MKKKLILLTLIVLMCLVSSIFYVYQAGKESIFLINKNSMELERVSYFINPLQGTEDKLLNALRLLKMQPEDERYFSEVPEDMSFESLSLSGKQCFLEISFGKQDNSNGSFHENRMLLAIFKTIHSLNPETKIFNLKVNGKANRFNHISVDFPMKLEGNNIVIVGK